MTETTTSSQRNIYPATLHILFPLMRDPSARRAICESAFFGSPILDDIDFAGSSALFTTRLVSLVIRDYPEQFILLLNEVAGYFGEPTQTQIEEIKRLCHGDWQKILLPYLEQPETSFDLIIELPADKIDLDTLPHKIQSFTGSAVTQLHIKATENNRTVLTLVSSVLAVETLQFVLASGSGALGRLLDLTVPLAVKAPLPDKPRLKQAAQIKAPPRDLLPPPFEWVAIPAGRVPAGRVTLEYDGSTHNVEPFWMAKYPVTNAQFAKFMEAGGYHKRSWWPDDGWRLRKDRDWTEPRYWRDSKWNGANHPVVGVSWYEAIAYCQWLSEQTGQKILLPTEMQWQWAAQGDDGRDYPWGSQWNRDLCNNNVDNKGIGKTTPVTQYEGKGDSPFGVVDMAGNVWEWCLTEYNSGNNDTSRTEICGLRGGSWYVEDTVIFRCDYRDWNNPINGYNNGGFRLARSH